MQQIRELAEKYAHAELEACIDVQLAEGRNACFNGETAEETMNALSRASYIKRMLEEGEIQSVTDGMRKLAGSIRSLQQNVK